VIRRGKKEPFLPRFLTEKAIRTVLQNLYWSIVGSNENAKVLLEKYPSDVSRALAKGNAHVRECLIAAASWLCIASQFAISNEIFYEQILQPVRCTAHFLTDIRGTSSPTTALDGIIFGRSIPYYSKAFGEDIVTLSLILPGIESVMSLRCREKEYELVEYGNYLISGLQPVPYVNRVHYVGLSFKKQNQPTVTQLSSLDFLKVSFHDIGKMDHSLAFENFCEIESDQLELRRRHLGSACILCGRILAVNIPLIVLESVFEPHVTVSLLIRQKLLYPISIREIKSFQGKYVRTLSVFWSKLGFNEIQYPELCSIEIADNPSNLLADDIAGFVRIRGKVTQELIASHYPSFEKVPQIRRLEYKNGWIRWIPPHRTDHHFKDCFTRHQNAIIEKRATIALNSPLSPVITPPLIFDRAKLRSDGLARMICQDDKLRDILLEIVKKNDDTGSLPTTWMELAKSTKFLDPVESYSELEWLRNLRLIKRTASGIQITPLGSEVAYLATAEVIGDILRNEIAIGSHHLISVSNLAYTHSIGQSLLLRGLKEIEKTGQVNCSELHRRKCKLFWFVVHQSRESRDISEDALLEFQKQIESLLDNILGVLGSVPYSRL
jgi:hypothetical protein